MLEFNVATYCYNIKSIKEKKYTSTQNQLHEQVKHDRSLLSSAFTLGKYPHKKVSLN